MSEDLVKALGTVIGQVEKRLEGGIGELDDEVAELCGLFDELHSSVRKFHALLNDRVEVLVTSAYQKHEEDLNRARLKDLESYFHRLAVLDEVIREGKAKLEALKDGEKGEPGPAGPPGPNGTGIISARFKDDILTFTDSNFKELSTDLHIDSLKGKDGESITGAGVKAGQLVLYAGPLELSTGVKLEDLQGAVGPAGKTGDSGPRGHSIAEVDVDEDEWKVKFTLEDGSVIEGGIDLELIRGEPGERGDSVSGLNFDPSDHALIVTLSSGESIRTAVTREQLQGLKGDPGPEGPAGPRGAAGRDKPILSTVEGVAGVPCDKGDIVHWKGGLWLALRKTNGCPEDDVSGFQCIVAGVVETDVTNDSEDPRRLKFTTEFSDGSTVEKFLHIPHSIFHNKWEKGNYSTGDIVQFNRGLWTALAPTSGKPGESKDWRLMLKFERGPKGPTGPRGSAGVGLKSVYVDKDKDVIIIKFTDGSEHVLDIERAPAEEIEGIPLRAFRGKFREKTEYYEGDIVTRSGKMYLVKKNFLSDHGYADLLSEDYAEEMTG